jgi:hypothetical protein
MPVISKPQEPICGLGALLARPNETLKSAAATRARIGVDFIESPHWKPKSERNVQKPARVVHVSLNQTSVTDKLPKVLKPIRGLLPCGLLQGRRCQKLNGITV